MRPRTQLPSSLLALASRQAGVVSRSQLAAGGLTRGAIARVARDSVRVGHGVYLLANPGLTLDPTWEARLWAGLLMGESSRSAFEPGRPCLAGLAAAVVHGLAELDWERKGDEPHTFTQTHDIEVLVAPGRRMSSVKGYRFTRVAASERSVSTVGDIAATSVADTVFDLCAGVSPQVAVAWVDRACQRRLITPREMFEALSRRSRVAHRGLIAEVLRDQQEGTTTELERAYRDRVERPHGLPQGRRQARDGQRLLDVLYELFALVVELDGKLGHVESGAWRDRCRDNAHTVRGARSLRFGWHECTATPCAVAWEVGRLLVALGWDGEPQACDNCPADLRQSA